MRLLHLIDTSKKEFNTTVNKVLEDPQYSYLKVENSSFVEKLIKKISEAIGDLFEKRFSNFSVNKGAVNAISTGILILIAVFIVFIVIKLIRSFERNKRIKNILGEEIDENTTPFTLKEKAAEAVGIGDFRQAIRYDYIALLLLMHEKGLIYIEETMTNEEIYNYLRIRKFILLEDMRTCINLFNLVWYGHKKDNQEMYERWTRSYSKLWDEVKIYEEKIK